MNGVDVVISSKKTLTGEEIFGVIFNELTHQILQEDLESEQYRETVETMIKVYKLLGEM
ncbi:hypothetical protein [Bacillus thuringiensis]|uniref:hypothetical protein n=1 Tax=Bacillus thuringiensis TaxID=1428 RepID=UPI0026E491DE|nr:hypothetical protein [Bacillus thuringiensis]MDO6634119.1 hypothetical protein [Bacillus thuringiensis]MDO6663554.1 hypothetical protein [Bacillus thuringiensis]MDO6704273.1 hypothetical protein [Bacillus thuringiensis]